MATPPSNESRSLASDDKEQADVQVCLFPGVFNLQELLADAPTGWETPPLLKPFGANVYYYGLGGGGVAYPDMYYFDLNGRALRIVFDGSDLKSD